MTNLLHSVRFPNESDDYRSARNELLDAEIELRRAVESVAAKRRALPIGGEIPEDYVFEELSEDGDDVQEVRMSGLFSPGKHSCDLQLHVWAQDESRVSVMHVDTDGLDGQCRTSNSG